jgi:large subunit ribosomal protein L4
MSTLIVVQEFDANLWLAARNLPHVGVLEAAEVDPVSLVGADTIVVTADALKSIEGRLQ